MIERQYVTRVEWKKHVQSPWNKSHRIWEHLKDYVPGWGYSKAEIDAFFEGEDSGKKQVDWARITSKPGTFTPSAHTHVKADITDTPWAWADVLKTGSNLTDLATRQHAGLTDILADDHHPQSHTLISHTARDHHHLVGLGDDDHTQYHTNARGDARYYTQGQVDTKLALQDTLAEMDDVAIPSPEDGEVLVYDGEQSLWIASTQIPSHNHDDRYYTETELNNGQLDNIYFGEDEFLVSSAGPGDSGKPIKLNAAGQVDATMIPGGGQDELVKVGAAGGSDYLNASYFQRDIENHVRIKLNTLLTGVDADKVDGLHAASFALTTRKLDDFGTPDDNEDLNATILRHGLLMKLGGGTTNFLRADGTWAAIPDVGVDLFFRAYVGANQEIGATSTEKVEYQSENYDPDSKFFVGIYRYSPGATGYYRISASIYTYLDAPKVGTLYIYKNGAEYARKRYVANSDGFCSISIRSDIQLTVSTDYIEIYYRNGDVAARTVYAGSNQSWFEGAKFG